MIHSLVSVDTLGWTLSTNRLWKDSLSPGPRLISVRAVKATPVTGFEKSAHIRVSAAESNAQPVPGRWRSDSKEHSLPYFPGNTGGIKERTCPLHLPLPLNLPTLVRGPQGVHPTQISKRHEKQSSTFLIEQKKRM